MIRVVFRLSACAALCLVNGCGEKPAPPPPADAPAGPTESAEHSHGAGPHGGTLSDWGGGAYHVEFTVDHDKRQSTVYVLASDAKTPAPIAADKLQLSIDAPPFQVELSAQPLAGEAAGSSSRFIGRHDDLGIVREFAGSITGEVNGTPYAGDFAEVAGDPGQPHEHTPHDGVVAALWSEAGQPIGFVELKLHDDKGDLEAWLAKDRQMTEPMDFPADTTINIAFQDFPGKTATLAVRNHQQNEDEDGQPNLRNGMTNYFIFPGESEQDPKWLMGRDFRSAAVITFTANGDRYRSEEFTLVPHTHAEGHTHPH